MDPSPAPADLQVEHVDGVLRLTMDRPAHLNALTPAMTEGLAAALEAVRGRDDVRVVLLAGAGSAFCSGADVSGPEAHTGFDVSSLDRANRLVRAVVQLEVPVVAAVGGIAAGVGCSLALACDLAVARESAGFLLAFARIGLMPDGGATATVAAAVGRARALRMALLGEVLPARDAFEAGLVSHLAADDAFDGVVEDLLARLAAGPPLAHAATKKAVNAATLGHLHDALERERTGQSVLLRTDDVAEGMRAFSQRRRPDFPAAERSAPREVPPGLHAATPRRGRRGHRVLTPARSISSSAASVVAVATPAVSETAAGWRSRRARRVEGGARARSGRWRCPRRRRRHAPRPQPVGQPAAVRRSRPRSRSRPRRARPCRRRRPPAAGRRRGEASPSCPRRSAPAR